MALNAAHQAQRAGKLTASRIACLMTGESEKIHQLWLEMTGQALPQDLDDNWAVRLGEATEHINLLWFQKKNYPLSKMGEFLVSADFPWAACTLDAWCEELKCPVEAKHCGGREPFEVIIARYQPQLQWQMLVTGAMQAAISVIFGANEPLVEFIERDWNYQDEMIVRGRQFLQFVEAKKPPVELEAVAPPIVADHSYDMRDNLEWMRQADRWKQTAGAVEIAADAAKILKSLVPADALKAFGHGIRITRDRAGRLSLREGNG